MEIGELGNHADEVLLKGFSPDFSFLHKSIHTEQYNKFIYTNPLPCIMAIGFVFKVIHNH